MTDEPTAPAPQPEPSAPPIPPTVPADKIASGVIALAQMAFGADCVVLVVGKNNQPPAVITDLTSNETAAQVLHLASRQCAAAAQKEKRANIIHPTAGHG